MNCSENVLELGRVVTTQESFPYNPGLPSTNDVEDGRRRSPDRRGMRGRTEKQEKWNWANSAGHKISTSLVKGNI